MRISDWSSDVCSSDLMRVGRLVASKPAGLRYGSAARHIVDETPGGRAAPAPQQAVFDRAHSVADRPVVDSRHQIARQLSPAPSFRWIVEIARRAPYAQPVVAGDIGQAPRTGRECHVV